MVLIICGFPPALGVASFCVWAFVRHPSCRPLAAGVFFAPVARFALLQFGVKLFGAPAITTGCRYAAPCLPVAAILFFPRAVGRLVPRLLRTRGAYIAYLVIQGLMIVLWVLLLLHGRRWTETGSTGTVPFILSYAVLSILAGVAGLIFSYMAAEDIFPERLRKLTSAKRGPAATISGVRGPISALTGAMNVLPLRTNE